MMQDANKIYSASQLVNLDVLMRQGTHGMEMASDIVADLVLSILKEHPGVDFTRLYGYISFNNGGILPTLHCSFLPYRPPAGFLPRDWHEMPADLVRALMSKVDPHWWLEPDLLETP